MTRIFNDPSDFAEEALAGFCDLHADLVRQVPGGAVRRRRSGQPKVAVLAGGGSGHYPAFAPGRVWAEAAGAATAAAEATAALRPRKGRARPLAEKSLGTPDPGATSLAMIFRVMGPHLTAVCQPAGARS